MIAKAARRRDGRIKFLLLGIFVAIFLFSFLAQSFKDLDDEVEAASLVNFDPGYIISDYTMGNYNAMTEAEIQVFLNKKGNCRDTRTYLADRYPNYSYHIKDGHFVCLAEETFGEGTAYGEDAPNGESAAHIIYKAAQDYKINPQVIIVLLQKEQSLITDSWPNNRQFRSATGYGCPDTAPCNSEYYGFKNQVRKAAAMFRTVLDGGWTNYPLGNNYIQYNPSASCGGSVVNIRSLATSALYRYTPYQPNASALAAGYGTGDSCGAYGNRNFYLYFEDWFSGITDDKSYTNVDIPRYMEVIKDTYYINPSTGQEGSLVGKGTILRFNSKILTRDDKWCIRAEDDTKNKRNVCILREDLGEVKIDFENVPDSEKEKVVKVGAFKINIRTGEKLTSYNKVMIRIFPKKVEFNNNIYYITEYDANNGSEIGVLVKYIEDIIYEDVAVPRYMRVAKDTNYVIPQIMERSEQIKKGTLLLFTTKIKTADGEWCIRTVEDTSANVNICILRGDLKEVEPYLEVDVPRKMQVVRDTYYVDPYVGEEGESINKNKILNFDTKILDMNGRWCIRADKDTKLNMNACILREDLSEVEAYIEVNSPRKMQILRDTYYINPQTLEEDTLVKKGTILDFATKVKTRDGEWCIRTIDKTNEDYNLCIVRKDLGEI